jgi:hypothetical protein
MTNFNKNEDNMAARTILPQQPKVTNPQPAVDVRATVLDALSNPNFMWRTAEGIASETGLSLTTVDFVLDELSESLIRSASPDEHGRIRYTTLGNYRAHAGILRRVLSALSDQVR